MEEKIINEEQEEVLENTIPEELKKYLEADENALGEIENVLNILDERMTSLNNEKEKKKKSFEDRLEEFKQSLAKEKEDTFNEFAKREQDIDAEKAKIESIKLEEQAKQVNYIDSLKEISSKYSSKINSIEEAIKACEDNDTLNKALEEEKNKLLESLSNEYNERKEALNKVLTEIGIKEEPKVEEKVNEPVIEQQPIINNNVVIEDENEVISHEPREDVINEIYGSEDVMEGHVFPYLKSVME